MGKGLKAVENPLSNMNINFTTRGPRTSTCVERFLIPCFRQSNLSLLRFDDEASYYNAAKELIPWSAK